MIQHFKQILKDIFVYGIGKVVIQLFAFITLPIYTRIFVPAEYGIITFVSAVIGIISIFLGLGILSGVQRYFYDCKDEQTKIRYISTGFWFLIIWVLIILIALTPTLKYISSLSFGAERYALLYAIALISAAVTALLSFLQNILRIHFHPVKYSIISFLSGVLTVGFSLLLILKYKLGILGFFLGGLIGSVITLAVCLILVFKNIRFTFSLSFLKNILYFAVPLVPAGLAYWIFGMSDRIILGKLSTMSEVGLYAIAVKIIVIMEFARYALGEAWSPRAYQIYTTDKHYPEIFGKMLLYVVVGFSFMAIGFVSFAPEFLRILTTPAFYSAAIAVGPLALGAVAYASTQVTAMGIGLTRKTKYISYFAWMTAVTNLGLNFLLIPRYGMLGAAIATMISYFILTVAYYITTQKLCPLKFESSKLVRVVLTLLAFVCISYFIHFRSILITIFVKLLYCFGFFFVLYLLNIFEDREIAYFKKGLSKLKLSAI